jgi:hypothetical protein
MIIYKQFQNQKKIKNYSVMKLIKLIYKVLIKNNIKNKIIN